MNLTTWIEALFVRTAITLNHDLHAETTKSHHWRVWIESERLMTVESINQLQFCAQLSVSDHTAGSKK